jgi:hypothetical protein
MLTTKKLKNNVPATAGIHEPTNEEIAVRAYLIWEKNGKPHGQDRAYWLQAEAELQAGYKKLQEAFNATAIVPKPKAKAARPNGLVKSVKSALTKKRW